MRITRQNTIILLAVAAIICINSCKKENMGDCLKSTGDITTEERATSPFYRILLEDDVNLIITQDTFYKIEVEAGENLIPLVNTIIEEDTLTITNSNTCNWVRSYKNEINVYVTVKELSIITYSGSGNVLSTNTITARNILIEQKSGSGNMDIRIDADTSYLQFHTGTGDITCSGSSAMSFLYNSSNGFLYCSDLQTTNTFVSNSGTGDIYLNVDSSLTAFIHFVGSIFYKGNPSVINEEIDGTGKLIKQ